MKKTALLLVLLFQSLASFAQQTFPVNGVNDEREGYYALTNVRICTQYDKKPENATIIIKDGKIEAIGTNIALPKTAVVLDMKGKFIYPSFIELDSNYGLPEPPKKERKWTDPPQELSTKKGAYGWNEAIKPEIQAYTQFAANADAAKGLRNMGFGTVLTFFHDGIARGTGTVVSTADGDNQALIVKDKASAHYSLSKGSSKQDYPSSQMGSIALLRQTHLDGQWYKTNPPKEYNISLAEWNNEQTLPQFFESQDRLTTLRADKIGDEFGIQYIIRGVGDEYQRLDAIKTTNAPLIIPVNFPNAYDVEDPFETVNISTEQMKHWDLAPANLALLAKSGIPIAITAQGSKKDFAENLKKAIARGLSPQEALKALTYTPANLLNLYTLVGSLEKGKIANFLVVSDTLFTDKAELLENWVQGKRYQLQEWEKIAAPNNYTLTLNKKITYTLTNKGSEPDSPEFQILIPNKKDTTAIKVKHQWQQQSISLLFDASKDTLNHSAMGKGFVRLSGWTSPDGKQWSGRGQLPNGEWVDWVATAVAADNSKKESEKKKQDASKDNKKTGDEKEVYSNITYPFLPFGWEAAPKSEAVLFTNATVWTNEKDGILTDTDVLIENGKIAKIGKNLAAPASAKTISAKGKHLTAGIIDEHSHIAISKGVNEGSQACSAEVRIGDVVNSEDINIYRQLSGGVVAAQLLHGSANPIGGQSALIKLRWGLLPEQMKIENADGFIKFALGENVKQSNWGDNNTSRYPQSRMGVEQIYENYFTRAREYYNSTQGKKVAGSPAVRRDLELDALAEILNKKRFITCHSYVQSEITMLMRVAEQFGFRINTFTHILEGYKIADKMKEHGVNASTFSDWWAYKYEVVDAIPYNAAILQTLGVTTAINSDDAEMGRRLNHEAAKGVKYGGMSEEEALKMVTLNPAIMLHLDSRMGSIRVGKDADIVLWNDHPLSVYAQADQTYVDGVCYFDREKDKAMRQAVQTERNRLIQKMLAVKKGGGATQKGKPEQQRLYHCGDLDSDEHIDFYEKQCNDH